MRRSKRRRICKERRRQQRECWRGTGRYAGVWSYHIELMPAWMKGELINMDMDAINREILTEMEEHGRKASDRQAHIVYDVLMDKQ